MASSSHFLVVIYNIVNISGFICPTGSILKVISAPVDGTNRILLSRIIVGSIVWNTNIRRTEKRSGWQF